MNRNKKKQLIKICRKLEKINKETKNMKHAIAISDIQLELCNVADIDPSDIGWNTLN